MSSYRNVPHNCPTPVRRFSLVLPTTTSVPSQYATEALEVADGTAWEASALVFYGEVLAELGDAEAAGAVAVRALRVALDSGLENWFRIGLRDLARAAAERRRYEDAVVLLAASRHGVPFYGLDSSIDGPIEERCREELGHGRFDQLTARGEAMTHDQLMNLVDADQLLTVPTADSEAG